jgi:glutamate synthase (NADPH/NADH) small chain
VEYDQRGNVKSSGNSTNLEKIFVAGDVTRGASLVVWAIRSGRDAAKRIHQFVTK